MPVPEWGSFLSIVDASLNPVVVSDLDEVVFKELMAKNRGLTLLDLKKRFEYPSVTTTSGERSDEQKSRPFFTLMAVADNHLSQIASAIPPVDLEVLTVRIIKMNATQNATSSRNSRKRKRSGIKRPIRVNLRAEATILEGILVSSTLWWTKVLSPPTPRVEEEHATQT